MALSQNGGPRYRCVLQRMWGLGFRGLGFTRFRGLGRRVAQTITGPERAAPAFETPAWMFSLLP